MAEEENQAAHIVADIEDVLKKYGYDGGLCEITFFANGILKVTIKN